MIYLAFFGDPVFFGLAFGFDVFLADEDFFVADDFGFFGVVVFAVFGLAAFFVEGFLPAVDLALLALAKMIKDIKIEIQRQHLPCFGLAALVDFGVALDRDFVTLTFFGFAAVSAAAVGVAGLVVLAVVATFLAGFVPADFERARFFVADEPVLDDVFFDFVEFFFAGLPSTFDANLNEPLAPLPLVCLKYLALTPFLRANLRCWFA